MALIFTFLLGIVNFAMHAAVLGTYHPALSQLPPEVRRRGRWITLGIEFMVLLGAMLLSVKSAGWAFVYAVYTAGNAVAAYFLIRRRF